MAVDTSSRTSAALLRVLLHERLGRDPEYVPMGPSLQSMLEAADAALLIGDPALYSDDGFQRLDLGEEWTRRTGLPFVFAFWAGREGVLDAAGVARLQEARRAGEGALGTIASSYNGLGSARAVLNELYLRSNIVYDLGEAELMGLREFFRRAHARGIVPRVPELRFHGHP